jgi:hypothetical protein
LLALQSRDIATPLDVDSRWVTSWLDPFENDDRATGPEGGQKEARETKGGTSLGLLYSDRTK